MLQHGQSPAPYLAHEGRALALCDRCSGRLRCGMLPSCPTQYRAGRAGSTIPPSRIRSCRVDPRHHHITDGCRKPRADQCAALGAAAGNRQVPVALWGNDLPRRSRSVLRNRRRYHVCSKARGLPAVQRAPGVRRNRRLSCRHEVLRRAREGCLCPRRLRSMAGAAMQPWGRVPFRRMLDGH